VFHKGQSVLAKFPDGHEEPGRVVYQRMDPNTKYTTPQAVSVFLDSKRDKPGYAGSMFWANDVRPDNCTTDANETTTKLP
jgi:hypothetical protein